MDVPNISRIFRKSLPHIASLNIRWNLRNKNYLDEAREQESAKINQYCIRFVPCALLFLAAAYQADAIERLQIGAILIGFFLVIELTYYGINRDGYIASVLSWIAWSAFAYLWYIDHFSNMLLAAVVPAAILFVVIQPFVFYRNKKERDSQE